MGQYDRTLKLLVDSNPEAIARLVFYAWLLRDEDREWLHQEYEKMVDLFQDSPALKWMEADVTKRVTQRITEQVTAQVTEQVRREERRRLREERKKALATIRQTVVELVVQRFPAHERLARAQVRVLHKPESFQPLLLRLALARDAEEAQDALLAAICGISQWPSPFSKFVASFSYVDQAVSAPWRWPPRGPKKVAGEW